MPLYRSPPPAGHVLPCSNFFSSLVLQEMVPHSHLWRQYGFSQLPKLPVSHGKRKGSIDQKKTKHISKAFLHTTLFHTLKLINSIAFFLHFQMWHYPPPFFFLLLQSLWRDAKTSGETANLIPFSSGKIGHFLKIFLFPIFFLSVKGKTT